MSGKNYQGMTGIKGTQGILPVWKDYVISGTPNPSGTLYVWQDFDIMAACGPQGIQGQPGNPYPGTLLVWDDEDQMQFTCHSYDFLAYMGCLHVEDDVELADQSKVTGIMGKQGLFGFMGIQGQQGIQGFQGFQGIKIHFHNHGTLYVWDDRQCHIVWSGMLMGIKRILFYFGDKGKGK